MQNYYMYIVWLWECFSSYHKILNWLNQSFWHLFPFSLNAPLYLLYSIIILYSWMSMLPPISYPISLFLLSLPCLALCLSVIHWVAASSPAGWPYSGRRSEIKGHLWLQRGLPCHRRGLRQPLRHLHSLTCKCRAFSCMHLCVKRFLILQWTYLPAGYKAK